MQKYPNENQGKPGPLPYEEIPYQLSNEELLKIDKERLDNRIFPAAARLDRRGRIINPQQFIIADKGAAIDRLVVGRTFWLESSGTPGRIGVRVLKSRKPSVTGKRYVLVETLSGEELVHLEDTETQIYTGPTSPNSIGVIHPGTSNPGGRDHSGQINGYGVAFLVIPLLNNGIQIQQTAQIAAYENDAALGTATIAVLDSGIRFTTPTPRLTISSDISWDFVSDDSTPEGDPFPVDNHYGLHGTKICSIIKRVAPEVGILPVKVSNQNGQLSLYDALCGLEFARTHGARVVNASWSFTSNGNNRPEEDFPLLLRAIRDLEESGVVVVAAAGNRNQYTPAANGHIGLNGAPNIYPACYSSIQDNVVTVTTIVRGETPPFSVFENFSSEFVDTGALTNGIASTPIGEFRIPGFIGSYRGSSFATPYVAAQIARILSSTPGYISKRAMLHRLREFHEESCLSSEIRDGGSYVVV